MLKLFCRKVLLPVEKPKFRDELPKVPVPAEYIRSSFSVSTSSLSPLSKSSLALFRVSTSSRSSLV